MTAIKPGRRKGTARELAERLGVSERTIRNYIAEPRADYDARTAARHARIHALRAEGLTMRAIAEREGVSVGTVHYALNKPERESA